MNKIEFICVGSPKCGTTWLWKGLRQHREIFMPEKKELHYFNRESVGDPTVINPNFTKSITWYLAHFSEARSDQLCGEFTPAYLGSSTALDQIFHHNPKMKIIVVVRNPVERACSDYRYRKQTGWLAKNASFKEAIKRYPVILDRGIYGRDILRYIKRFSSRNVHVVFYDDIKKEPSKVFHDIERFLGIGDFVPDNIGDKTNVTSMPKYWWLNRLVTGLKMGLRKLGLEVVVDQLKKMKVMHYVQALTRKTMPIEAGQMDEVTETVFLQDYYHADIELLESITGRSLDSWKSHNVSKASH